LDYKTDRTEVLRILQLAGSKLNEIPEKWALAAKLEYIGGTAVEELRTELRNREKHYDRRAVRQNLSQQQPFRECAREIPARRQREMHQVPRDGCFAASG
jgi:hypothetical protein